MRIVAMCDRVVNVGSIAFGLDARCLGGSPLALLPTQAVSLR